MNEIKLVYKSTTELYQPNQPPEITKLFQQPEHKYTCEIDEHRNYEKYVKR